MLMFKRQMMRIYCLYLKWEIRN